MLSRFSLLQDSRVRLWELTVRRVLLPSGIPVVRLSPGLLGASRVGPRSRSTGEVRGRANSDPLGIVALDGRRGVRSTPSLSESLAGERGRS